ncbi:septum formation inhibitor Maf [bacterium]|nr:septum formation inhibitor Maf [bacterium]
MTSPLILASASPRRREILDLMGIRFEVIPGNVDEKAVTADHPRTLALRLAYAKARAVAAQVEEDRWVLAADTVVTKNMVLYGKPDDREDAVRMLSELAGDTHEVITAVALAQAGRPTTFLRAASTRVTFHPMQAEQIAAYVDSGEPMDKAGAYGIQGLGGAFVAGIQGDYYNVMGLPCVEVRELLEEAGLDIPTQLPPPPDRFRQR